MSVRFNAPPGWPVPLPSWAPGDDWMPDPSWPTPPHGWTFWVVVEEQAVPDLGEADSGYGTDRESWLASLRVRASADALVARNARRRSRAACAPSRAGQLLAAGRAAGTGRAGHLRWTSCSGSHPRCGSVPRRPDCVPPWRARPDRTRHRSRVAPRIERIRRRRRRAPDPDRARGSRPTGPGVRRPARAPVGRGDARARCTSRTTRCVAGPSRRTPAGSPPRSGPCSSAARSRRRCRGCRCSSGPRAAKARATAETEADSFSRALDLAQVVIAQHRAAAARRPVERPRRARPLRRHRRARRRVRRRRVRLHVHRRRVGRRDVAGLRHHRDPLPRHRHRRRAWARLLVERPTDAAPPHPSRAQLPLPQWPRVVRPRCRPPGDQRRRRRRRRPPRHRAPTRPATVWSRSTSAA